MYYIFASSGTQTWADILEFLSNIGSKLSGFISALPDFLKPIVFAYLTFSVVYLVIGRGQFMPSFNENLGLIFSFINELFSIKLFNLVVNGEQFYVMPWHFVVAGIVIPIVLHYLTPSPQVVYGLSITRINKFYCSNLSIYYLSLL